MFDLRVCRAEVELRRLQEQDDVLFDLVFMDADKRAYAAYLSSLLGEGDEGGRRLLADGALVVTDNVLWKHLVLAEDATLEALAPQPDSVLEGGPDLDEVKLEKQKERMRRIAAAMHKYNMFCRDHASLSPVVLPIRDGISLCRYSARSSKKGSTLEDKLYS